MSIRQPTITVDIYAFYVQNVNHIIFQMLHDIRLHVKCDKHLAKFQMSAVIILTDICTRIPSMTALSHRHSQDFCLGGGHPADAT